jgi:tetratricopeptide (TPR) repeat protein
VAQPNSAQLYYGWGLSYRTTGLHDKALADFGEAIRRDPTSASLRLDRAATFEAKGDLGSGHCQLR